MIIDCHTHINNYHNEEVDSLEERLEALRTSMRRNRVDIALVLTSYREGHGRPSTRQAVEATRDSKQLYIVAGIRFETFTPDVIEELRDFVKDGHVRGFKLYPGYEYFYPFDRKLEPVYDCAAEFDVPVMIHSGDTYTPKGKVKYSHPLHIDDVAVDHPAVKFVICHVGNPWIRDCMEVVYKNANVYTDISGLVLGNFSDRFEAYMRKQLQEMLLYGVQPEKVLFGSDWPISSMESYVQFIEELKIADKDRRRILYENSAKLFRLSVNDVPTRPRSILDRLR